MAAIGAFKAPHHTSSTIPNDLRGSRTSQFRSLSFASSHITGEKIRPATTQRRRSGQYSDVRAPIIVSPKAVSDSKNSQTCLDPDASRVCLLLFGSVPTLYLNYEFEDLTV